MPYVFLIITRKDSFVSLENREGEEIRNFEHDFGESPRRTIAFVPYAWKNLWALFRKTINLYGATSVKSRTPRPRCIRYGFSTRGVNNEISISKC